MDNVRQVESRRLSVPQRLRASPHLGTRQYARIVLGWVEEIGLDSAEYGMHSADKADADLPTNEESSGVSTAISTA
jgi:hypothetical protein